MAEESSNLQKFASEFLSLARESQTGTYKVVCVDGRERYLLFQEGSIIDIDTREELTVLSLAILRACEISDRELRRTRKIQAKNGIHLSALLLERAEIPEDDLVVAVHDQITHEICSLFTTGVQESIFFPHTEDERLEGFEGELSEVFEVYADPEELFLEATMLLGSWEMVEQNFSLLRDVYYATPSAFKYFREEQLYPHEVAVIGAVDGRRDVSEVVDQVVKELGENINHFQAFAMARTLVSRGELELINPVQMFQLGVEHFEKQQYEKALKLFSRAAERGLDDFDLRFKIAQTHEALGSIKSATRQYREFGEKCLKQSRPNEAIRSFRRICELEPGNLDWHLKLLKILIQENRSTEALTHGLATANRQASCGNVREGLDILLDLQRHGFKDQRLAEKIIELAEHCGDEATLRSERERLANDFCARKDIEKALEMYQQMFCDGNDSPEVRLKLIDLHLERGDRKLALEHIKALLSLGEPRRIKDEAVLLRLHKLVCEFQPSDARSNRWLVDHYLRAGKRDAARDVLQNLAVHHERQGEFRDAALVLKQLILLEPQNLKYLWRLATAFAKLSKQDDHIRELRKYAQMALHGEDTGQAEKAFNEILKASPLDIEARKALADLCANRGESQQAATWFKEVALLNLLSGNIPEAQDYCRRLLVLDPQDPEIVHKLGELCRTAGDEHKAFEQFLKSARIHLENRNMGIAREALTKALQLRPTNVECQGLKRSLEEMEGRLSWSYSTTQTAAPAASSVSRSGEPFQPSAPVVKKTSLSGITARLRNLKAGNPAGGTVRVGEEKGPPGKATSAGGARVQGGGISNAASKLKALAAGGTAKPPPQIPKPVKANTDRGSAAEGAGGGQPAPGSAAAPQSPDMVELMKLQAKLQGEGASKEAPPPAAPAKAPPSSPAQKKTGGSLSKAAEILARLKKGSTAPAPEAQKEKEPG